MLRNLQLGGSSVDLKVRRHGDEVSLEVLRTRGARLQISIVSVALRRCADGRDTQPGFDRRELIRRAPLSLAGGARSGDRFAIGLF